MLALFTIAAAILASAVAAPAVITGSNGALDKRCKAKVENKPWQLTHIAAFEADPNLPTGISSISFDFCDTNKGLELQTRCEYNLPMHSGLGPIDHDNYHRCNNQDVQFKYEGTNITVSRTYKDDCLGDYPYNSASVYGHANTDFVYATTRFGYEWLQAKLDVHITEQAR